MFSKFPSIYTKEKDECDFRTEVFYFRKLLLILFLRKVLFIVNHHLLVAVHSSKISIHYGGQVEAYLEAIHTCTMEFFYDNS